MNTLAGSTLKADAPWAQHELSAKLQTIASPLPDGHAHPEGVTHDHRQATDDAVPDVLAFLHVRTWVVRPVGHAQRSVQTQRWIGVHLNRRAEDVCVQR